MADELRAAVEWMSPEDVRRMVHFGNPVGLHRRLVALGGRPESIEHHRVLAEAETEDILAMCDLVDREGTGRTPILKRIPSARP